MGELPTIIWLLFALGFGGGVLFENFQNQRLLSLVDGQAANEAELEDNWGKVLKILRRTTYLGMAGIFCLLFLLVDPPSWIPLLVLGFISPLAGAGVGLWLSALARHLARRLSEKAGE